MKVYKKIKGFNRIIYGKRIKHPSYVRTFELPDVNSKKINLYGKGRICPYCNATKDFIIKTGTRKVKRDKNKQRYYCYWCKRRFTKRSGLFRMKNNFKTINLALELLKQGYTTRDIQKKLNNIVSHTTIMRWRKKWNKITNQQRNMM